MTIQGGRVSLDILLAQSTPKQGVTKTLLSLSRLMVLNIFEALHSIQSLIKAMDPGLENGMIFLVGVGLTNPKLRAPNPDAWQS